MIGRQASWTRLYSPVYYRKSRLENSFYLPLKTTSRYELPGRRKEHFKSSCLENTKKWRNKEAIVANINVSFILHCRLQSPLSLNPQGLDTRLQYRNRVIWREYKYHVLFVLILGIIINKLTSLFYASVLLSKINFVIRGQTHKKLTSICFLQ